MFNLFKKDKPTIHAISIPTFGWSAAKDEDSIKLWINKDRSVALSINYFETKPDIPSLYEIEKIRYYYREQTVQAHGGLIQVDLLEIDGYKIIKTIFKIKQEDSGITYMASLTIPFKSCSYVIKIQAPEIGLTGVRERIIADQLLKQSIIKKEKEDYTGWSNDPYLENFTQGLPMNLSEKEEYDQDFPDHPLSVSRKLIAQIESGIELKEVLKEVKKFNR